jgi:hypothetical protein
MTRDEGGLYRMSIVNKGYLGLLKRKIKITPCLSVSPFYGVSREVEALGRVLVGRSLRGVKVIFKRV